MEAGACCICLSEVQGEALVCPDGHVTCHEDLNGLVEYISAPEQASLRIPQLIISMGFEGAAGYACGRDRCSLCDGRRVHS